MGLGLGLGLELGLPHHVVEAVLVVAGVSRVDVFAVELVVLVRVRARGRVGRWG